MFHRRQAIVRIEPGLLSYAMLEGLFKSRVSESGVWIPEPPGEGEPAPSLADTLVHELKSRGIGRVRLELPLSRAITQFMEMPPMNRRDVRKAIPFELERRMPIPLENFFWGFRILGSGVEGYRVLAAAVRKTFLQPFLDLLKANGVAVASIEFAMLKFISSRKPEGEVLYVAATPDRWDVVATSSGKLKAISSVDTSSDASASSAMLASAIKRDMPDMEFGGVVVSGTFGDGSAEILRPLLAPEAELEMAETSPVIVARTRRSGFKLDILPPEYRIRRDYHNMTLGGLLACLVISFLLQGYLKDRKDWLALQEINEEIQTLKASVDTASGTMRERESVIRAVKVLRPFLSQGNRPLLALRELSRIVPSDTWLVGFSMDEKGKIEIDGYSSRSSALLGLLEDSDMFSGVEMAGPVVVQPLGEHFSLRMYWQEAGGE